MAYIATVKILLDELNESNVYDGINEILRSAQMGGPNGEDRGWVVDWKFESVESANESLNDAIANETYEEGDAFRSGAPVVGRPFMLIVDAYAISEFGDGPAFAEITVDQAFVDRVIRLRRVCKENDLESVSVWSYPDRWDNEDLKVRDESLRVYHGESWWFEGHPKHADYNVETRAIEIDDLLKVIEAGPGGTVPHSRFRWSNGTLYYASDPGLLTDLIDMVDAPAGSNDGACAECGEPADRVIGCPDGAEICESCFDAGQH